MPPTEPTSVSVCVNQANNKMCPIKSIDSTSYKPFVKRCRVCGDVASGFNFNGLSCESCKAFFRRNAVKNIAFKCRRNKTVECAINLRNRKYCKKCRLKKCYEIGMKKEFILSFKESMNKQQECVKQESSSSDEDFCKDEIKDEFMIQMLPTETYYIESDVAPLQPYDLERLQEVQNAQQHFKDVYSLEMVGQAQSLTQAMNLAEFYVVKIIKFCKSFSAYKSLNLDDQMIILKAFHPEISAIRAAFLYNSQKDGFPVIADSEDTKTLFVPLDWSGEMKNKKIVTNLRKFLFNMQLEMENDSTIRDLILSQLLFSQRDNLNCTEFLQFNHTVYSHLLRRYLQHKYQSMFIAEDKYSRLMQLLTQIGAVAKMFREIYQNEVDRSEISKVLVEMYNL